MNHSDARRSIFTLGRFQILAEAFEKVDKKGKAKPDSTVVKVTHMWGEQLENPVLLETEEQAFDFYADNVISNDAFAPPPFVAFATKKDIKNVFKKLSQWEKRERESERRKKAEGEINPNNGPDQVD
jgi:hypothetical protein